MSILDTEKELTLRDKFAEYYKLRDVVETLSEKQKGMPHLSYQRYLTLQHELYPLLLTSSIVESETPCDVMTTVPPFISSKIIYHLRLLSKLLILVFAVV